MEIKVKMYGAGQEVGRSCIEVEFPNGARFLLDAGLKITPQGVEYPLQVENPKKIDLAFGTHSHIDHVGAYPWLCMEGLECPIICTGITREVSEVLLEDSHNLNKNREGSRDIGIGYMARACNLMQVGTEGEIKGVSYRLTPSGHIPGGTCVYLEYQGKSIWYTSDINSEDSLLLNGISEIPKSDILIMDTTNGNQDHRPRFEKIQLYRKLRDKTLNRGGSWLNGVFGVGRAQEAILINSDVDTRMPIYLDGLGLRVLDILLKYPELESHAKLVEASQRITRIESSYDRNRALNSQGIYLATSGMWSAGPILTYTRARAEDALSTMAITGFQADGTGGRQILDTRSINIRGERIDILCEVVNISLSAHDDKARLARVIAEANPRHVIAQHGDRAGIQSIVDLARMEGRQAYAPANGDQVVLNL